MKHYRIEEIASEIEIARVGNSGSHYLLCPCAFCEGLRDNADVVDTGLAQGIDDGSECPEGHRLIAPQEYTSLSALQLRMNLRAKLVDIDGFIAQVDALRLVQCDDQAILGEIFHSARLRHIDFNARLEDGGGDHKDDEEHQNHVHEGDHVDLGERSLSRFGELRHIFRFYQNGRVGAATRI